MTQEEIFDLMWKAHMDVNDPRKAINSEAEKIAKGILKLNKKMNELERKCINATAQKTWLEKENKSLHEHIQKQHVSQPIKMFVCEQCGKELGGAK